MLPDVGTVDAAMETSGADTPLSDWGQWIGPLTPVDEWPQRGIVCEGAYVGAAEDASFPELTLALAVADFGDDETLGTYLAGYLGIAADEEPLPTSKPGGETIGRCPQRDRTYDCYEVWTDGSGFAVMVHIQDQTFFDRPPCSTGSCQRCCRRSRAGRRRWVTSWRARTAARSTVRRPASPSSPSPPSPPRRSIARRRRSTTSRRRSPRPGSTSCGGWTARLDELESENGAEPATRLVCTDVDSLVTLDVIDFADVVDADEFVAAVGLAEGGTPDDLEPGAVVVGSCTSVSGQEYCNAWWHDGTFVIGVTLFADADVITRNDAGEVLTALVPTVRASLQAIAG